MINVKNKSHVKSTLNVVSLPSSFSPAPEVVVVIPTETRSHHTQNVLPSAFLT